MSQLAALGGCVCVRCRRHGCIATRVKQGRSHRRDILTSDLDTRSSESDRLRDAPTQLPAEPN